MGSTRESRRVRTRRLPKNYDRVSSPYSASGHLVKRKRRGGSTLRALVGWFLMGMIGTCVFILIATPLLLRVVEIPPRYIARLPQPLQQVISVLGPQNENRGGALPTAEATIDPEMLQSILGGGDATATPPATAITPATQAPLIEAPTRVIASGGGEGDSASSAPPTPTNTLPPVVYPTFTPTPMSVASVPTEDYPIPPSARLYGFTAIDQTWNNCGPATIAMTLSRYNWAPEGSPQAVAASWLKPDPEDKNVSPWEIVAFVNDHVPGVKAIARTGGTLNQIKRLLTTFPVMVETGYQPAGEDWMGHYRLIVAYDDTMRQFFFYDSHEGIGDDEMGVRMGYAEFDRHWQAFNRVYIVVYQPAQEQTLRSLLGADWDAQQNLMNTLERNKRDAQTDPRNPFAFFNLGTTYTHLGDYQKAAIAYDQALQLDLPWRMSWYQFGPYEALFSVGRYGDVLSLAEHTLGSTPYVEETYYWLGRVYEQLGKTDDAIYHYQQAVRRNPNYDEAKQRLSALTGS